MSLDAFIGVTGAIKTAAETVQLFRAARTQQEIDVLHAQLLRQLTDAEKRALDAQQVAAKLHDENVALNREASAVREENQQLRQHHLDKERYELRAHRRGVLRRREVGPAGDVDADDAGLHDRVGAPARRRAAAVRAVRHGVSNVRSMACISRPLHGHVIVAVRPLSSAETSGP